MPPTRNSPPSTGKLARRDIARLASSGQRSASVSHHWDDVPVRRSSSAKTGSMPVTCIGPP
jgi:hypothetical protein